MGHNQNALFFLVVAGVILYLQNKESQDIPAYGGLGPYPTYGPPAPPAGPCPAGTSWVVINGEYVCQ